MISPETEPLPINAAFEPGLPRQTGEVKLRLSYPSSRQLEVDGVDIERHFQNLPETFNPLAKEFMEVLKDYISLPIIGDNITDHESRRLWKEQLKHEHKDELAVIEENKLRGNKITTVLEWCEFALGVIPSLKGNDDYQRQFKALRQDVGQGGLAYVKLSAEEKVNFVNRLADFAKSLYVYLSHEEEKRLAQAA